MATADAAKAPAPLPSAARAAGLPAMGAVAAIAVDITSGVPSDGAEGEGVTTGGVDVPQTATASATAPPRNDEGTKVGEGCLAVDGAPGAFARPADFCLGVEAVSCLGNGSTVAFFKARRCAARMLARSTAPRPAARVMMAAALATAPGVPMGVTGFAAGLVGSDGGASSCRRANLCVGRS